MNGLLRLTVTLELFNSITVESNVKVMREKVNDHQFKRLLIVKRILLVIIIGNLKRTVWIILIRMLVC